MLPPVSEMASPEDPLRTVASRIETRIASNLINALDDLKPAEDTNRRALHRLIQEVAARAVEDTVRDTETAHFDPAVLHIARVVERTLPAARRRVSESTIARVLDAIIDTQDPIAKVSAEIDVANAKARVRYMNAIPTLTAEDVAANAGSKARNRHQAASRWKSDGKIFAVPWQGLDRYPAFQFNGDRPIPAVAAALGALPARMSSWEVAFWFVSTNGWLDGQTPHELLDSPERVLEAARREGEAVVG